MVFDRCDKNIEYLNLQNTMKDFKNMEMRMFTKRNLIIILFIIFLFLRLFTYMDSVNFHSDSLKYIETSKHFPYHTLYNNQLYLLHPPFYPYVIYFATLIFQEDYLAGVFISLFSSIITFFVLYRFFMMLIKDFNITFITMVFFTLSVEFIIASKAVLKESLVLMLIFLAIYYFIRGVKFNNKKSITAASIFGALSAITSDHVLFLIPAFLLSYIFFNSKKINLKRFVFPNLKYVGIPIIVTMLFYGSWAFVRFYQYSNYEYYPNGYSGTPLSTHDLGMFQLISPQTFEDYSGPRMDSGIIATIKRVTFNFGYMLNMEPFSIPRGLNFATMKFLLFPRHVIYMISIYLPLAIITLYGLYKAFNDFIKTKQIYNNISIYMLGMFLIFIFPITQKYAGPRLIYIAYIFFFYFISFGLTSLLNKKFMWQIRSKFILIIVIFLLLVVTPIWAYNNDNFVFFTKKALAAQNTGDFINHNIPRDAGIMVQPGYVVELIYLTDNRIIGLYHNPEKLFTLIDYYNISYIVVGRRYTEYYHLSEDSVEFIRSNPDKFESIAAIKEDYSDFYVEEDPARTDEIYIYKFLKNT